jgi:hypothetical protein
MGLYFPTEVMINHGSPGSRPEPASRELGADEITLDYDLQQRCLQCL